MHFELSSGELLLELSKAAPCIKIRRLGMFRYLKNKYTNHFKYFTSNDCMIKIELKIKLDSLSICFGPLHGAVRTRAIHSSRSADSKRKNHDENIRCELTAIMATNVEVCMHK